MRHIEMCAACALCASVGPVQPFYITKREEPYKRYSQSAEWGVMLTRTAWKA